MNKANLIAGFIVLGIACLFITEASVSTLFYGRPLTVSVVPLVVSICLAIAALYLITFNMRGNSTEYVKWPVGAGRRLILHVIISLVAYILLVEVIGYFTATFIFMLAASSAWRLYSLRFLVITSLIYCLVLFVVFEVILEMPMPRSLIGLP